MLFSFGLLLFFPPYPVGVPFISSGAFAVPFTYRYAETEELGSKKAKEPSNSKIAGMIIAYQVVFFNTINGYWPRGLWKRGKTKEPSPCLLLLTKVERAVEYYPNLNSCNKS